ncbi:MAG: RNA polymerase sigma factor [Oligoflexia bacterium]|nr:RNA polymerase sigma factor [Oligoflexia bacterium]
MQADETQEAELQQLIRQAQKGEEAALSALVDRFQSKVFRFCFHLCGEKGMAEDLCQEVLVKALKQLSKLDDPAKFTSWIMRIAKNQFLDEVRRPGHTQELLEVEREDGVPMRETADTGATPADVSMEVREALEKLKPDDRMLLVMIDIEEWSYAEAAEIISVSENAVRSRLHRARNAFLKVFNRE